MAASPMRWGNFLVLIEHRVADEFAKRGECSGAVDRCGSTVHQNAHTNGLGGFLFGRTGTGGGLGVRCDTAVATLHYPDSHSHQFFHLPAERPVDQRRVADGGEGPVDIRNQLAQSAVFRAEPSEHVMVMLIVGHADNVG